MFEHYAYVNHTPIRISEFKITAPKKPRGRPRKNASLLERSGLLFHPRVNLWFDGAPPELNIGEILNCVLQYSPRRGARLCGSIVEKSKTSDDRTMVRLALNSAITKEKLP